jgi:hypothetical protein
LRDDNKVFLPNQAVCATCHAPGKARSDCAECHRYHAIDEPSHGVGSSVRAREMRMSAEDYMRRKLPKTTDSNGK